MRTHRRPDPERMPDERLLLRPLLWTIGYSALHMTVLLRGVLAYQHPERLTSWSFWSVNVALIAVGAGLMTAGWGRSVRWRR